ncbi:hypothetical protein BDN72DRAFT_932845 [Pluteus cervinus]|uniref:Uncharacterized protein n=1 Tax=Pluteus cervinus TaxID=181527 RepID=A0ACD3A9Y5_9AGAR|nr:hypothetical protein BDN72DRAFT_932845 [Pluteus cervinus]
MTGGRSCDELSNPTNDLFDTTPSPYVDQRQMNAHATLQNEEKDIEHPTRFPGRFLPPPHPICCLIPSSTLLSLMSRVDTAKPPVTIRSPRPQLHESNHKKTWNLKLACLRLSASQKETLNKRLWVNTGSARETEEKRLTNITQTDHFGQVRPNGLNTIRGQERTPVDAERRGKESVRRGGNTSADTLCHPERGGLVEGGPNFDETFGVRNEFALYVVEYAGIRKEGEVQISGCETHFRRHSDTRREPDEIVSVKFKVT